MLNGLFEKNVPEAPLYLFHICVVLYCVQSVSTTTTHKISVSPILKQVFDLHSHILFHNMNTTAVRSGTPWRRPEQS